MIIGLLQVSILGPLFSDIFSNYLLLNAREKSLSDCTGDNNFKAIGHTMDKS